MSSLDGDCQLVGGHPGSPEVVATVFVGSKLAQRLKNRRLNAALFPHTHAVTVVARSLAVKGASKATTPTPDVVAIR
jgi:hypothetical protein